jgi:hypothetical protein
LLIRAVAHIQAGCIKGKVKKANGTSIDAVWRIEQGVKVGPNSVYVTKDMLDKGNSILTIIFSVIVGLEEIRRTTLEIETRNKSSPNFADIRIVQSDWVDAGTEMTGALCRFCKRRL